MSVFLDSFRVPVVFNRSVDFSSIPNTLLMGFGLSSLDYDGQSMYLVTSFHSQISFSCLFHDIAWQWGSVVTPGLNWFTHFHKYFITTGQCPVSLEDISFFDPSDSICLSLCNSAFFFNFFPHSDNSLDRSPFRMTLFSIPVHHQTVPVLTSDFVLKTLKTLFLFNALDTFALLSFFYDMLYQTVASHSLSIQLNVVDTQNVLICWYVCLKWGRQKESIISIYPKNAENCKW